MMTRKISDVKVLGADRKRTQIYVDTAFGRMWVPLSKKVLHPQSVVKIGDRDTLEVNSVWWDRHLRRDKKRRAS
jgi:hypothetical protein